MLDHIRETLELMRKNELAELHIERQDLKLRLRRNDWQQRPITPPPPVARLHPGASVAAAPIASDEGVLRAVTSPVVGTFRRVRKPGAGLFAEVGQAVKKGQVLALVEAIGLTHEIKAACDGSLVDVSADEGHVVQYGDTLFHIRPGMKVLQH
jgi:acetyl-CoA carboxylase biotin carboxyl carrier protein